MSQLHTLSELTDNEIPQDTFQEFVRTHGPDDSKTIVEKFLGHQIDDKNIQPLFNRKGKPLTYTDGTKIVLPWTWPAALSRELMTRAGCGVTPNAQDVADIELPCWQAVGVHLFADGYHIATLRSNASPNAIGRVFTAAAGTMTVDDRNAIDCGLRLIEQKLSVPRDNLHIIKAETLPSDPNHSHVNVYDVPVNRGADKIGGACLFLNQMIAIQSGLTLVELVELIKPNHEAVGIVAAGTNLLRMMAADSTAGIPVLFYPSWTPENGYEGDGSIASVRDKLINLYNLSASPATRPQASDAPFRLGQARTSALTKADTQNVNELEGSGSLPLSLTVCAAQQLGLLQP